MNSKMQRDETGKRKTVKAKERDEDTELVPLSEETEGEELDPGCEDEGQSLPPMMSEEQEATAAELRTGMNYSAAIVPHPYTRSGPGKSLSREAAPRSALVLDEAAPSVTMLSESGRRNIAANKQIDYRKTSIGRS